MASPRRALVAANWKMNGLHANGLALAREVAHKARQAARMAGPEGLPEILVCPPATLLFSLAEELSGSPVLLGAQDCHPKPFGAYTGDLAAPMLKDAGCSHVIVGHSERRQYHHESSATVCAKAEAAIAHGLVAILCVGETEAERDSGREFDVVGAQLAASVPSGATPRSLVIAYEPIWAIGTGRMPDAGEIAAMHGHIRAFLANAVEAGANVRVLYGGSVKPAIAVDVLAVPDVDGALVGGASLDAADFWSIVRAVPPA